MAITAIVIAMIAVIISVASKSFKHTNEEVNLQMEAQTAINQLSTILMEASEITTGTAAAPDKKYLIKASDGSNAYAIYLIKAQQRLYLIPAEDEDTDVDAINPIESADTQYQYLFAEYVDDIGIETDTNSPRVVIDFVLGDSTYTVNKKVALRNAR
jgi:hypothetical protein